VSANAFKKIHTIRSRIRGYEDTLKGYEMRIPSDDEKGNWINLAERRLCLHEITVF